MSKLTLSRKVCGMLLMMTVKTKAKIRLQPR